jgi:D-sedoheptulose 7-phosphate isomerase
MITPDLTGKNKKAERINWLHDYLNSQVYALEYLPIPQIAILIDKLEEALDKNKQIFVLGNGGSAANASHFATDLGKGASDSLKKRFRIISLNDNVPWMTAISNDQDYENVFVNQLQNYARRGDIAIALSVSGTSKNCVKAIEWAKTNGLYTVALVGREGKYILAKMADLALPIKSSHFGVVEDAHMTICHMVAYYFMCSCVQKKKTPTRRRGCEITS